MAYTIKGVEPTQNATLAEVEKHTGPSNFLRLMAHRPEAMQHFLQFYDALMGSTALLDHKLREMIHVAVSAVNECGYCSAVHRKAAFALGLSEAEVREIENETDDHFSLRERAALMFARDLTRTALVDDDARYRVQELFTADEYVELAMIVGLANFTNRFNSGLAVPIEDEGA